MFSKQLEKMFIRLSLKQEILDYNVSNLSTQNTEF